MGMSVSTSMGFENRELIKNSAKNLVQGNEEAQQKASESIMQNSITNARSLTTQEYILLASTQITLNQSLKETLKYLQKHANSRKKEYTFGDLWKVLNTENEDSEKNPYQGEVFEIDQNKKNIFAA